MRTPRGKPGDQRRIAGIVLAELLVGIEFFRPRQRLGFGDGRAKPLPRDHRCDRAEGVLLAVWAAIRAAPTRA